MIYLICFHFKKLLRRTSRQRIHLILVATFISLWRWNITLTLDNLVRLHTMNNIIMIKIKIWTKNEKVFYWWIMLAIWYWFLCHELTTSEWKRTYALSQTYKQTNIVSETNILLFSSTNRCASLYVQDSCHSDCSRGKQEVTATERNRNREGGNSEYIVTQI